MEVDAGCSDRASSALAAGFSKNTILREVTLLRVPEELVVPMRDTLCANAALTVNVTDATVTL